MGRFLVFLQGSNRADVKAVQACGAHVADNLRVIVSARLRAKTNGPGCADVVTKPARDPSLGETVCCYGYVGYPQVGGRLVNHAAQECAPGNAGIFFMCCLMFHALSNRWTEDELRHPHQEPIAADADNRRNRPEYDCQQQEGLQFCCS